MWNITERSLEHQQDLIINFIDFKKAFDKLTVYTDHPCGKF